MSFNFPNTPTDGQTFQPITGGPTYAWNAATGAWKLSAGSAGGGAGGGLYVGDTPPTNQVPGMLWWESDTGNLYVWYADPDSSQWVMVVPGTAGTPPVAGDLDMTGHNILNVANINGKPPVTARRGNRVVNGNVAISQENGNTAGSTGGYYPADQWQLSPSGLSTAAVRSQGYPVSPDNSINAIATSFSVAKASLAATDYSRILHTLEGQNNADLQWGTTKAIPAVLRFNAACETAGTYSVAIGSTDGSQSWLGTFTCDGTTTTKTFVFAVPAATGGTWKVDNTGAINISFTYAVGSSFQGVAGWQAGSKLGLATQTNGAAVINKNLIITDVGFYADPDNTGLAPPWEVPDPTLELSRCSRYFYRIVASIVSGYQGAGGLFYLAQLHPTQMRAATPAVAYDSIGGSNSSAPSVNAVNQFLVRHQISILAAGFGYSGFSYNVNARM